MIVVLAGNEVVGGYGGGYGKGIRTYLKSRYQRPGNILAGLSRRIGDSRILCRSRGSGGLYDRWRMEGDLWFLC